MITEEHHRFFAFLMGNVYHLFCKFCNFTALESLEIFELFGWDTILIVEISLINDIFRTEFVANFFFKLIQNVWTYAGGISVPVNVFFPCKFIKHQRKLMEKCRITDNIYMWICLAELPQTLHTEFMCLWLTHIKCNLMLHVFPVVDNGIVHVHRIPHNVSQKTYGIIMERYCRINGHIPCLLRIRPVITAYYFTCSTVDNFPPTTNVIIAVYFQHFRINTGHQMNG